MADHPRRDVRSVVLWAVGICLLALAAAGALWTIPAMWGAR